MSVASQIDLTIPLEGEALLVIDPYPLADSINFQLSAGTVPIQVAETYLNRALRADVKLQHHHGDRFTAWVNGAQQRNLVEIKVQMRKKRTAREDSPMAITSRSVSEARMREARKPQLPLPGIEPGQEPIEIEIPTMGWEQIGGDMDPGTYGGTIATADGDHIELIKIQPVREYVGDKEAKDVGFPFWTREAYFTLDDLDPKSDDVRSALQSIGVDDHALEDMEPTVRAIVIAEALLDYGRADEGPSGWSGDIGIPEQVKWSTGKVAGAEYLADEDEAFRDEVLGYGDIREAIEVKVGEMADQDSAIAWSTPGDQMLSDVEDAGFDPKTVVAIAEFGDAVAVNGDLTDEAMNAVETKLEAEGYEYTKYGGRIPGSEAEVHAENVIDAVADEWPREDIEKAAEKLDWWQDEIPWGTSGYSSVWAKRKAGSQAVEEAGGRLAFYPESDGAFMVGIGREQLGFVKRFGDGWYASGDGHDFRRGPFRSRDQAARSLHEPGGLGEAGRRAPPRRAPGGAVTENEMAVLLAIANSEYQDAAEREHLINHQVWSEYIGDDAGVRAAGLRGRSLSAVFSTLQQKGLIRTGNAGPIPDANLAGHTVALTAAGVDALPKDWRP